MAPPRFLWTSQINHLKWNLNSLHRAPHLSFPEVLGPNPSSGPPFLLPSCPREVQRACCHPHQRLSLAHLHQRPWSKPSATAGLDGCQPARGSPSFRSCPAAPFLPGGPPPQPRSPPGPLQSASRNHDTLMEPRGPITLGITSKRLCRPASPFTITPSPSPVPPGSQVKPDTPTSGALSLFLARHPPADLSLGAPSSGFKSLPYSTCES